MKKYLRSIREMGIMYLLKRFMVKRTEGGKMENFKMFVSLARKYFSGECSRFNYSADMAKVFADKAEKAADLDLDKSMSLRSKIEWMEAFY